MGYVFLTIAIISEVIATSALKASEAFTHLFPSILVILGYAVSFYCLSLVLKTIPVSITYAIWSGVGISLITLVDAYYFRQVLDLSALLGIALITAGVIIIFVFSNQS